MKKAYRIFFSHGSEDKYIVNFLKNRLEDSGACVFADTVEIQYGDNFQKIVIDELMKVDELLVLLTPTSIRRPWVHAEIGAALARKKRVVPVSYYVERPELEECGLLSVLGTIRLLSMNDFESYLNELKSRVQGYTC